ncbi:MAG TPA: methylated-DNA--[protein]-cysteine S-methyltransferase [Bordetella sp.]|nr:methylated-DNA--[protein]-cysteine S-methyltransferase [Bordetella sp.]
MNAHLKPPPRLRIVDTPLGPMRLHAEGGALTGAWFLDQDDCPPLPPAATTSISSIQGTTAGARVKAKARAAIVEAVAAQASPAAATAYDAPAGDPVLDQAALELSEYFAGRLHEFSLPMAPHGTPFQQRVWDALRDIPFGGLESYGALSARCAQAAAVRAVAQAVGRNPISIFIPCHRIIGSNSALTGFGGGLPRKQALLALEGHTYTTAAPSAKLVEEDTRQGNLW